MTIVEKILDIGEVLINYAEGPDNGPPLILIHGFLRWWKDFQPVIPELSNHHHIYAVDLRGHGRSDRAQGNYTLRDYSRDILALLEHIEQPAILFGHSLGGWVSLMVSAEKPSQVKAVIIGDSPLDLEGFSKKLEGYYDWWTTNREYSLKTYEELLGEVDAVSAERLSLVDPDVFELWIEGCADSSAFLRLFKGYDITGLFKSIRCPVLLLQGNDKTLPDRDVEYATSVLPSITYVQLKNHGHYLGLDTEDTEELMNALTAFLGSLS